MKFVRSAQVRSPKELPGALLFGRELASYLYARFALELRVSAIPGSEPRIRWEFEADGFHHISALSELIADDITYWEMLDSAQHLFYDGALTDAVVCLKGQPVQRHTPRQHHVRSAITPSRTSLQVVARKKRLEKPFAFAG